MVGDEDWTSVSILVYFIATDVKWGFIFKPVKKFTDITTRIFLTDCKYFRIISRFIEPRVNNIIEKQAEVRVLVTLKNLRIEFINIIF